MTSASNPTVDTSNPSSVYLPLLFFFNRNPGLYLPLIALQYHEVRLDFDLTSYFQSYFGATGAVFEVWANYVYLDTEERRRFAQKGHEYLIEQVQHTGGDSIQLSGGAATSTTSSQTIRLSFNHPVKELIWCYQNTAATANNSLWNFSTSCSNVNVTCDPRPYCGSSAALPHTIGAPRLFSNTLQITGGASLASNVTWVEEGSPNFTGATGSGGRPPVQLQAGAERPGPLQGAGWQVLQPVPAVCVPLWRAVPRCVRLQLRPAAGGAPADRHLQLLSH
jgi:hypothetical protein